MMPAPKKIAAMYERRNVRMRHSVRVASRNFGGRAVSEM